MAAVAGKAPRRIFRFRDCVLDIDSGTLQRDGCLVPVRAKTFRLLCHLASNAGRVLSKDELLDAVWPDVTVTEDSLTQAVRDLRRTIGDLAQETLRNIARRGYIFDAEAVAPEPKAIEPRIAVLPFLVENGDPHDAILMDGIVEEITNGLARFKTVAVVARHSAFTFRPGSHSGPAAVGESLDVDFLVEGLARRVSGVLRISVVLVECRSGRRLWGEIFRDVAGDLLALQAAIVQRIISRLVANIEGAILQQAPARAAGNAAAFEHLVRGIALLRSYGETVNEEARVQLLRALEIDPDYGLAHAYLALAELTISGYGAATPAVLMAARDRAMRAVSLMPEEARCHRILALIRLYLREHAAAEQNFRRALELNPYDADTLAQLGYLLTMRGHPDEGLAWLDSAVSLNPLHPDWYHFDRSVTLYSLARYAEAAEALTNLPRRDALTETRLAACHAMVGDDLAAARHLERACQLAPAWDPVWQVCHGVEFDRAQDLDHLLQGVRAAMDARAAALAAPAAPGGR